MLFSVFTVVSLFAQNQTEVELSLLWRPLAVCVVAALGLYGLFLLITRSTTKAGVLASLVVAAFFFYGAFLEQRPSGFVVLWLALFVVAIGAVLKTEQDLGCVTVVLLIVATVAVVPPTADIVRYQADHPGGAASDPRLWPSALEPPAPPSGAPLPDIFVIIPDDYARPDILQQYFGYDDREFRQPVPGHRLRDARRQGLRRRGPALRLQP